MQTIIHRGQPKSTQHCYKFTCKGGFASAYMDKKCKDLKADYQWQAGAQWKGGVIAGDIRLTIRLYFGTKRTVDFDNFNKLFLDSLEGIVFVNDSQIQIATISKHYDKENPRIEVDIHEA